MFTLACQSANFLSFIPVLAPMH